MNEYLVSIVTPVYNSARFISETIDSIQSQTYSNWELLLIDDCSSDNSYEIIKNYMKDDDEIIYINNEDLYMNYCPTYVSPMYDMYQMQCMGDFAQQYPSLDMPYMNGYMDQYQDVNDMWMNYYMMMQNMMQSMMKPRDIY